LQASEDSPLTGEDDIGFEIDGSMTYALAKNLKYWVEGGWLFADDYYGVGSDDAVALRHGIELTF
jgi:predicted porin